MNYSHNDLIEKEDGMEIVYAVSCLLGFLMAISPFLYKIISLADKLQTN